jgi:hypothetical protein
MYDNYVIRYLFKKDFDIFGLMGSSNPNDALSGEDDQSSNGTFLPHISTLYTRRSARLIRSAEKGASLIVIAIAILIALSLIDTFEVENVSKLLPGDSLDVLISIFSVGVLAVTGVMLRALLKSRQTLEKWADTFEQNALRSSLGIALSSKSKEQIVRVLPEVVEELGEPLQLYISKGSFNEFFDATIDRNEMFDVLIDSKRVVPEKDQAGLRQMISEYGAIAANILDRNIDNNDMASFLARLEKYKSKSGNDIGLAILVCSKVSSDAENYIKNNRSLLARKVIMVEVENGNNDELSENNNVHGNHAG